ncbi:hypothetical protein L6164_037676 [Bauhinia variegata]|uniref:Uncharacterized protein n=1 Tax=Bauhinia variegata TaxID=167791 RepID=A0ACB9KKW3_BAUVA|nr:hypothetical protein L6164_037676 [Bauhinia variegata]
MENYFFWRTTILSTLAAFDMDGFVNGDITVPPQYIQVASTNNESQELAQTIMNPEYTTWKKTDRLVLLWIKLLTTDKILGNIARATSAREAWETLEKMFYSQSRLACAIQNSIPKDDLVNCILHDLDVDYWAFQTAITTRRDPITVDELLGMLLQKEEKIKQSKSLLISANVAQPNFHSGFKQGRRSYNYGGNHYYNSHSGNTNQAAINGSRSHSNSPKITCQICNKNGHITLKCYNRFNHAYNPEKASKVSAMIASPNTV